MKRRAIYRGKANCGAINLHRIQNPLLSRKKKTVLASSKAIQDRDQYKSGEIMTGSPNKVHGF